MIRKEEIRGMSYPDFVALLGQKNSPPGGMNTIEKTIELAHIDSNSHLLDLACSTGFSSREISKLVKCSSVGIDICERAIKSAKKEARQAKLVKLLDYQVSSAENLPFKDNLFSHVISGCNFSFIRERKKALYECFRVLEENGRLCAANFYYINSPTNDLLEEVEQVVGFKPSIQWSREWWLKFFKDKFILESEEIYELPVQKLDQIKQDVSALTEENVYLSKLTDDLRKECFNRLLWTRKVLNEHRKYQKFNITVWKPIKVK